MSAFGREANVRFRPLADLSPQTGNITRMARPSFAASFRASQPRWSRWLFRLVGLPGWVAYGFAIFRTTGGPLPWWGWCGVGAFVVTGAVQWMFYLNSKAR
jgi:hypothetical protein